MSRRSARTALILGTALLGIFCPAAGQVPDSVLALGAAPDGPGSTVDLRFGGGYMGNFFQAPVGTPPENVLAGTGEVRLTFPLMGPNLQVHGGAGGTLYSDFDPSLSILAGVRWNGGIHLLEGDVSLRTRSPRIEVGDTLGFADVFLAEADYKIRPLEDLQVGVLAGFDRQVYSRSGGRDNHAFQIGGSGRYYGLGYLLSPELGAAVGHRDVELAEEDYDERVLWATLRSVPVSAAYLSLRYRSRLRQYRGDDRASRNFKREDDRRDLTLTVNLSLNDRWTWTAYFSYQDAGSTRESRTFVTQYIWTGLSYQFR